MAWIFADSFDFYAVPSDMATHWDGSVGNLGALQPGRFTGGQSITQASTSTGIYLTKTGTSNDATHHIVVAFNQPVAPSGSVKGFGFTLYDGATAQCTVLFRSDGAILLTAGTGAGATLATYTGAFAQNIWNGFEFEITIHNTLGAVHIRKNGNTVDDFSATSLDTQASANAYANKITLSREGSTAPLGTTGAQLIDDLLWFSTSGAAPNTWVGDIRAVQLMPTSDASVQFSKSPSPATVTPFTAASTASRAANAAVAAPFTASQDGTIASVTVQITTGATGNAKAAIYDSTRATVLATSNAVVNPVAGPNTFTFASPLTVTRGTVYYLALDQDATVVYTTTGANASYWSATITYASFPTASPSWAGTSNNIAIFTVNITSTNSTLVNEVQQDGLTTYVYDSVVGHADLYDVANLAIVPASVVGVVTRGYVAKSDAGAKSAQLQLKSGGTTVQSTTLVLSTNFVYTSRVDATDPNTSAAWTPAAVNAVQVGPYVTA